MTSSFDSGAGRLSSDDVAGLPIEEYAFPGPLRDALVAAILSGAKTSTTSLVDELENEPLPAVGDLGVVIDSNARPVCVTEVTEVRVVRLDEVDLAHARDEGEGYESVAAWRSGHESFWHGEEFRAGMGDPAFSVTDATRTVLTRFRMVGRVQTMDSRQVGDR